MVEIPDDVAKQMAAAWRAYAEGDVIQTGSEVRAWADLLDPQPPTLREQVAKAWLSYEDGRPGASFLGAADVVLAVVADWLAAQPVTLARATKDNPSPSPEHVQRDHDVRLLRGGSDV